MREREFRISNKGLKQVRTIGTKRWYLRCIEPECKKRAQDKKSMKCKQHGGGYRCNEQGCNKAARDSKSMKCKQHGGGYRCNEQGCTKAAIDKKSMKCKGHGGGLRCIEPGCTKSAIDSKSMKCKQHGGGYRCNEQGCNKSAEDKKSMKCIEHGGGYRCNEPGCTKSAQDSKSMKCIAHGGGLRCNEQGCNKAAADSKSMKCKGHGGGVRCPNCIDWIDSQCGYKKYDNYCARCFKRVFPNDPRSKHIYINSKEIKVRNMINENFKGFVHNKSLYSGNCKCVHRRRIDHRKIINGTMLAIETDEFGHRGYDKEDEEIRYNDVAMIFTGKWVWIRFNPDDNYDKTPFKEKLGVLRHEIKIQIRSIEKEKNNELIRIIKLF